MHDVVIVGGGLTGLALARQLEREGIDWCLFEARERLGGRILGGQVASPQQVLDLGPSWFWPGQPKILELVSALGLETFAQHAQGDGLFEDEHGQQMKAPGFATMRGSLRLLGGMPALVDALAQRLPTARLYRGTPVVAIEDGVRVRTADGASTTARHVVLTPPPRVAATLHFEPALSDAARRSLEEIPSWMAGQAKFVAVYDEAFWRADGLSGDAMSRRGPLAEIHDASLPDGPAALFGFVGRPAGDRDAEELERAAVAQLQRLFGDEAGLPRQTFFKDWAEDPRTAVAADRTALHSHPAYGMPHALRANWDGRLHFASTELAPRCGGYLEGALESAEQAARAILDVVSATRSAGSADGRDP